MSELDKKKAELAFWEKIFFALFATIVGLAGWFSSHYEKTTNVFLVASCIVFSFAIIFIIVSYIKVQRIIDDIGEL